MDQGRYDGDTVKMRNQQGEEMHVRHGHGTYTYAGSAVQYEGDWVCNVKHGRGILRVGREHAAAGTAAGDAGAAAMGAHSVYEGDFVHGEMTGSGLKRWRDG